MVRTPPTAQAGAMTTTPPDAPSGPPPYDPAGNTGGDTGPRVGRNDVRDLGRLRRSRTDRKVAGVAGGLGRHLDVDPLILRVAFVVLVFFGGAGLILYGAAWLLVPEEGESRARVNLDDRSRSVALLIAGAVAALALVGDSWGAFGFPWPLALVALVALWLLTRNTPARPPAPGAPPDAPPYAPASVPPYTPPYTQSFNQPYSQPYSQPSGPPPYEPPAYTAPAYVPPVRVPNPRKRGPILFWFTLALIALAEGLLGIVDLAGTDVAGPAYPALAVGICGVMLVVGAFFGRAGGVILLGLIGAVVLAGSTVADRWDGDQVLASPTTAAAVQPSYSVDAGEIVLDLRGVTDLRGLDGRTVELDAGIGHLEVILPAGLAATVDADVSGPGSIELFGEEHGGIDIDQNSFDGLARQPQIVIDAQLSVGQIEVHR
jgi:phage shock protein PspC (stress-responsive transcriptional regulator)